LSGNLSFVIEGVLAGCARPWAGDGAEDELAALAERGFAGLVSLTEDPLEPDRVARAGLAYLHLPVRDFAAPRMGDVAAFVEFVRRVVSERGKPVAVHCGSGLGRTGTMLACFLVSEGRSAEEAMAEVRRKRPGSIESAAQEEAVRAWEARARGGHHRSPPAGRPQRRRRQR
jgi:atypical dual specificity phosphatase